jgi:hypothetical protein
MDSETIVCISTRRWNSLWRSTQQIMSRMAVRNRVIFFEPGRDPDKPFLPEFKHNFLNHFFMQIEEIKKNIFVVPTPSNLPHGLKRLPQTILHISNSLVTKINDQILIRHIWRAMKMLKVQEPILWFYDPFSHNLAGKFGAKLSCYHHYDEIAEFAPNARIKDIILEIDNRMASSVDVVFASSSVQADRIKKVNQNTYFLPNAVDFDLFNQAITGDLVIPLDIRSIPRPIIGFSGWMGYHIDVSLLQMVAISFPKCSLVLIGPDQLPNSFEKQQLKANPNVFFLGRKDMKELPSYLQTFDVALMPWLVDGHMRYAYPLKLHEYLAAGRPPVATSLPELRPFSNVVRIAETHEEFIRHIKDALADNSPQSIESRIAVARNNTWDQRVIEIYRVLEQHLFRNDQVL